MSVEQPPGSRGSLKWIQRAVNERWETLEGPILSKLKAHSLEWWSPLADDNFAEYRDSSFLARIGHPELAQDLQGYWPARGPQWDALGRSDRGDVLLVEAKAHVAELCTPGTAAGPASRARIASALDQLADKLGARAGRAAWTDHFYQLANRLAHLDFLRARSVPAWLVLVNFLGDSEMGGPSSVEAWDAAYQVAFHVMGLGKSHPLSRFIIHSPISIPQNQS